MTFAKRSISRSADESSPATSERPLAVAPLHVLLLEDSAADAELILDGLRQGGYEPIARRVSGRQEMLAALGDGAWQIVLLDYTLEDGETALEALAALAEFDVDVPAILISGVIGEEEAADALRAGARDFVNKGNLTRLVPAIARELAQVEARRERRAEREEAAQALRESEERFRLIAEHARDLVALLDVEGRFRYLSPSWDAILGFPPGTLVGMSASELIHPDDWPRGRQWGAAELREFRLRTSTEGWLWVEGLSYVVTGRAESHFAVIARDISERKQSELARQALEDELRQAQKMEAVGQLAGGIAHDFNNILTVISGYTEILLRRLGREAEGSMEIAEVSKAAAQAARLTRQLLAFSRKQIIESKPLDLNGIVSNTKAMLERLIGENIEFSTTLAEDLGSISADNGEIEQIIVNLVVNARDAMPDGGALVLETGNITLWDATTDARLDATTQHEYVVLTVTDTGAGMDAETAARIFEPYYTTKPRGAGTGLGLATVDGIVKLSGGRIKLESAPGAGTTIRIYFPRVAGKAEAFSPKPRDERSLMGSETVLLVEDDEALRGVGRQMLELYGYTVLLAGDGAAGLELALNHPRPIQLVMTDILMPTMGGIELAQRLSTLRPELKVLYTSGYNDSTGSPTRVAGAGYLEKPYGMEDLARTLRELLDPDDEPAPSLATAEQA
jgi:PAS domain S-box-containing protein